LLGQDTEIWIGPTLGFKLSKKIQTAVEYQTRYSETDGEFRSHFLQLNLKYRLHRNLSVNTFYRPIFRPDKSNRTRWALDLVGQYKKNKKSDLSLQWRLRGQYTFEHEFEETRKYFAYLRNRLKLKYDYNKKLTPWISGELYSLLAELDESAEFIRKCRFTIGFDWQFMKRLELSTYYRYQSDVNVKKPDQEHVIGLHLSYMIK